MDAGDNGKMDRCGSNCPAWEAASPWNSLRGKDERHVSQVVVVGTLLVQYGHVVLEETSVLRESVDLQIMAQMLSRASRWR
jgi:hypothetical protein